MSTRFQIAAILFIVVHSVAFGALFLVVVQTPLIERTLFLLPWLATASAFVAGPIAWTIAPRMQARFWRKRAVAAIWRR